MKRKRRRGEGCIYQPKGSANWWIKYRLNGRVYVEATGSRDRRLAEEKLKEKMARKALGELKPIPTINFEDMAQLVITDYQINERKSLDRVNYSLEHLEVFFGNCKAQSISSEMVHVYILQRRDQRAKNATINRELAVLKRMFKLAKISNKPEIVTLQENNIRTGFFEPGEFLTLREALPDYLKPVVTFAYYTGWRKSEILSLRWNQVDLEARIVRLNPGTTKNNSGRVIALDGELLATIEGQWERSHAEVRGQGSALISPYVFHNKGNPIRDFRSAWKSVLEDSGLSGRLFHDFRRTAIRNMVRAGVPQSVAMKISGHRTDAIFRRYDITSEEDLREAAKKTAEHVQKLVVVLPLVARSTG